MTAPSSSGTDSPESATGPARSPMPVIVAAQAKPYESGVT